MNVLLNCREWDFEAEKVGNKIGIVYNNVLAIKQAVNSLGEQPYCFVEMPGRTYVIAGTFDNLMKSLG
jgi:hypothetical protein